MGLGLIVGDILFYYYFLCGYDFFGFCKYILTNGKKYNY